MTLMVSLLNQLHTADIVVDDNNVITGIKTPESLYSELKAQCDEYLITPEGKLCQDAVVVLSTHGYRHRVFESDRFGPLRCGIDTGYGWLMYG